MTLQELLETRGEAIVREAVERLGRTRLRSYDASSLESNQARLQRLLDLTIQCVRTKNLVPMVSYAEGIARERFRDGFDLQEVQTAFNLLEEIVWKHITQDMKPEDYPAAFGLTSTVLGAGKAALATEYVSLASHSRVRTMDLSSMFEGT